MKGAAGPWGARGRVLLRHRQGGMRPVREPRTAHPCLCRHREWHGHQLPWDRHRFTHCTATALFPAQPYWSGNTGMDNLVMSSSEEKSCLHFLKCP